MSFCPEGGRKWFDGQYQTLVLPFIILLSVAASDSEKRYSESLAEIWCPLTTPNTDPMHGCGQSPWLTFAYITAACPIWRRLLMHWTLSALCRARARVGRRSEIMIAMMP